MLALYGRAVSRLRRHFGFNLIKVMQRELGRATRLPSECPGVQCRVLSLEEAVSLCADPGLELDDAWVRDAYQRGGVCLGAFSPDGSNAPRLVGYNWLAYEPTRIAPGVWVEFAAECRYSYKTFVRPEHRGQRIAQALHALADDPSLRRGRTSALNFVHSDNHPSVVALERSGSRCAGYVAYVQVLGKVLALSSPGAKACGVRFYGSHRPRLMPFLRRKLGLNLYRVLVRALPDQPEPRVLKGQLEYRMVSEAELLPWCPHPGLDLKEKTLRPAFARGDRCVGAFEGDQLVGYVFFAFQATPDTDGTWVDFDSRTRYAYKSFVLPAYRGRRMGLELYQLSALVCPSQDRSLDMIIVHTDNTPSLRSAQSVGGRAVGYGGYWKVLGRFVLFRSPGTRRFGFRYFIPDRPPALQAARAT